MEDDRLASQQFPLEVRYRWLEGEIVYILLCQDASEAQKPRIIIVSGPFEVAVSDLIDEEATYHGEKWKVLG